ADSSSNFLFLPRITNFSLFSCHKKHNKIYIKVLIKPLFSCFCSALYFQYF
ncbi:unnamed protein product, partial [Arabidopsis halleri]